MSHLLELLFCTGVGYIAGYLAAGRAPRRDRDRLQWDRLARGHRGRRSV